MNVLNAVEVIDKIVKNETSKSNTILNENLKYLVDDADYIKSEHIATGVVPMRLKFVTDIENYSMTGNTTQSGTPTPETPYAINSVGDYDSTTSKYVIPIICGKKIVNINTNTPLMAGEVLANNIKDVLWGKLVLTGNENWVYSTTSNIFYLTNVNIDYKKTQYATINYMSSHFKSSASSTGGAGMTENTIRFYNGLSNVNEIYIKYNDVGDVTAFKNWLTQQYIANTPVTVYYQLKTPLTENVTMPKIPNVRGTNIFDVNTNVKPSTVTVKYK